MSNWNSCFLVFFVAKTKTALIYVFSGTEPTPSTKRATEGPTGRTTKEAPCKPLDTTVTPTTFPSDDRIPIQCDVAIVGGGTFSFHELLRRKMFERRTSSYHYTGDKINETAAVVVYTSTQWPFFEIAVFTGLLTWISAFSGISGLLTAYALLKNSKETNVCILEKENRLGGKIFDHRFADAPNVPAGWFIFVL